jgi:hypothetical protein
MANEAISNFRRGVMLRYVTREPNLKAKRSCTGLGNLEVFLFVLLSQQDYVLRQTCFAYVKSDVLHDRPVFCSHALEYQTITQL